MLQIKNTLGGGKPEGLYVWKKYEAVTIPAAHITFENSAWSRDTTNDYMYKAMNSTDVDVSILKKEDFDGATGTTRYGPPDTVSISNGIITYTNSNTTKKCEFKVENGIFYQKGSDTYNHAHYGALTLDIVEHTRMGDFIDYIVSDKETAYPDGGVHTDGYWYKKVVGGAKISSGSFTFSTERDTVTINHGLNAVPSKFIIMQYSERAESGYYDVLGYSIIDGTKMFLSNKNGSISNVQAISENGTFVLDSTMLTIPKSYTATYKQDVYKYRWQGTYTWIAIAE